MRCSRSLPRFSAGTLVAAGRMSFAWIAALLFALTVASGAAAASPAVRVDIGPTGAFQLVRFVSDRLLVTLGFEETVAVWDLDSRRALWAVTVPWLARQLAVSRGGDLIAVSTHDTVSILRVKDGKQIRRWPRPPRTEFGTLAFLQGDQVLAGAGNGLWTWDLRTGATKQEMALPAYRGRIIAAISPDGRWLGLGRERDSAPESDGIETDLRLYRIPEVKPVWEGNFEAYDGEYQSEYSFTFTPDSRSLLYADGGKLVRRDLESGSTIPILDLYEGNFFPANPLYGSGFGVLAGITISRNGKWIVLQGSREWLALPLNDPSRFLARRQDGDRRVPCLALNSDGERLAVVSLQGTIEIWNTDSGRQVNRVGPRGWRPMYLAMGAPERGLLLLGEDWKEHLNQNETDWDPPIPRQVGAWQPGSRLGPRFLTGFPPSSDFLKLSMEQVGAGDLAIWGDSKGSVWLWNRRRNSSPVKLPLPAPNPDDINRYVEFGILSTAIRPDGRMVAASRTDGIGAWELPSRRLLWFQKRPNPRVVGFVGQALLVLEEHRLKRLGAERGASQPFQLESRVPKIQVATMNRLGSLLLIADEEGTGEVWALPARKLVRRLKTPQYSGWNSAFNPNGRSVLIWNRRTDLFQLYDLLTGRVTALPVPTGYAPDEWSPAVFLDPNHLVFTGWDCGLYLWQKRGERWYAWGRTYLFSDGSWVALDAHGNYDSSTGARNPHLYAVSNTWVLRTMASVRSRYRPGLLSGWWQAERPRKSLRRSHSVGIVNQRARFRTPSATARRGA